jgi:hypothetical protein
MLDDILHVRLQTLGVTEHSFDITVAGTRYTWILYDVGGAVSCYYHCLFPFFVDVSYRIPVERPGERPDIAMINAKKSYTILPQRHAWVPYFEDGKYYLYSFSACEGPSSASFRFCVVRQRSRQRTDS